MAKRMWTVELDSKRHTIELEHNLFTGRREIRLDGEMIYYKKAVFFDLGGEYPFQIGNHTGVVRINTNGLTYRYDCAVDGRSLQTGQPVVPSLPIPRWAWGFIVACVLIPVVSLGGAIPGALGGGGAVACAVIARDSSRPTATRVAICFGITGLCWGLFIAFLLTLIYFRS